MYESQKSLILNEDQSFRLGHYDELLKMVQDYQTMFANIMAMLDQNEKMTKEILEEFHQLELKLVKIETDRKKSRLKTDSLSVIAYIQVIEKYLSNIEYSEYECCNDIYYGEKSLQKGQKGKRGFRDETSFKNSFRKWYQKTVNQNKYPQILEYIKAKEKRNSEKKQTVSN